jgi:hypothetical protein
MSEISHLHHVGHVVHDLRAACDLYRRLGFACAPPDYPVLARRAGAPATPFGAANTHAYFARSFVEIVTVVDDGTSLPPEARAIPLQVPDAALPSVVATIERTVAKISAALSRFEGVHILVFATEDADATAARFNRMGIPHSGVSLTQRPGDAAPLRVIEIEDPHVPEGRLAVAEHPPRAAAASLNHANGALDLVEATLCVADASIDTVVARYERYLDHPARQNGGTCVFDLQQSSLRLVPASLQAEPPPALPAFVVYAVTVADLAATRHLLATHDVPFQSLSAEEVTVPRRAALGASVAFRQAKFGPNSTTSVDPSHGVDRDVA